MENTQYNIVEDFKNAMRDAGISPPDTIKANTADIQRFHVSGDKSGSLNGAYRLHTDGKPSGYFEDLKQGVKHKWTYQGDNAHTMPSIDTKAIQAKQTNAIQETAEKHALAAESARSVWNNCQVITEPTAHPYLVKKRINPHTVRLNSYKQYNNLVIPVFSPEGEIISLQFINPDGSKRFQKGGKKGFFFFGMAVNASKPVLIAEGFATGASLHENTGLQVFVAFDAGNLKATAQTVRKQHPAALIVLCADNDASGVGQAKAKQAALAVGGVVIMPPDVDTDFNDYLTSDTVSVKDLIEQAQQSNAKEEKTDTPPSDDWEDKLKAHVEQFNLNHAQVIIGDKHRIMRVVCDDNTDNREVYEFLPQSTLSAVYQNTVIQTGVNDKGKPIFKNCVEAWAKHAKCRVYRKGVVFKPNKTLPTDYLNTWKGYTVKPVENSDLLPLVKSHIEDVICNAELELIAYVYNWIAYTFQRPEEPAGAALVCRGEQGTGKGILFRFLLSIWGTHGNHISNSKHLVGNFNGHLNDCCFLFADEAFFSGDKQHEGVLKALITEPTLTIERKGIDAVRQDNYLKVGMATNNDWAIPASRDVRRYCVCDVSNSRKGDIEYFRSLATDCKNKDVQAAFLFEMLNRDISTFHTGDIPDTGGLRAQRLHSLGNVGKWLVDSLQRGYFEIHKDQQATQWDSIMTAKDLRASYLLWCENLKISEYGRDSETMQGRYLTDCGFIKHRKTSGIEYRLGSLEQAIATFENYEKITISN